MTEGLLEKPPADEETAEEPSAAGRGDHAFAHALRIAVGLVTVVTGMLGLLASSLALAETIELPPAAALLPDPAPPEWVLLALSVAALAGGVGSLRGASIGFRLCAGTWSAVAALVARPAVRIPLADPGAFVVDLPAHGGSVATMGICTAAAILVVATHGFCLASRRPGTRLVLTAAESLAGAFLLVAGLVAALSFYAERSQHGPEAFTASFLPLAAAAIVLQALALGILADLTVARALGIASLLGVAAAALLPDLLLDHVVVPAPLFWASAWALLGLALALPRRSG